MLGTRILLGLLSATTVIAVFATAVAAQEDETNNDFNRTVKRSKRGYEYIDYVPHYESKSSHYGHAVGHSYGGGKHYHHHHHSHKYSHCKHCHKKHYHDKKHVSLTGLLALLAPLALLPLITGAVAPLTMAPLVVPAMTQVVAGTAAATSGRRKRRSLPSFGVDSIHKYLQKVNPTGEYNDEVMAQYLKCSGMLDAKNHCLERLTCQYTAGTLSSLEKEVASLIIYTIVKNRFIPETFKEQMRKAASSGRQSALKCYAFHCNSHKNTNAFTGFGNFK
ncbi:uncharacterized protein LOC111264471 [Varroa jacobsoni]|uniref:Uncharacterized protein n=1 Tax=Varroa destructor TaxID=109461 RepID=A0A7M7IXY3_VARDE|nr:uncharacterized protein LOC111243191 [Varroa destructor]XP_022644129.1 uncharacterized protein LOC111243191 [Varroa destructor]XP_022644131.1 uncharacterized protein LOC111243191 [Varroa destructor]XP_022696146.1 uncharacterized protein LOC111264471 [Varroa jacobsoni]XP_022696147.1 uncharacterized protein LOC111264471 [Varroa jacobsoni]